MEKEIIDFLKNSNAIEGVRGEISLHDSINAYSYISSFKEIDIYNVLHCHQILMYNQPLEEKYKGHFRDIPVYIGGKEALHRSLIMPFMLTFIEKINNDEDWKETHVLFEKAHPFVDGNGRVGRILMNWHRQRIGLPILDINTIEGIQEYHNWFK